MPYIGPDGRILQNKPWSVQRFFGLFFALFNFIWMFFKTLFHSDVNKHGSSYTRDYRGGGGPPRPPQRRMGGFATMSDCNVPGGG